MSIRAWRRAVAVSLVFTAAGSALAQPGLVSRWAAEGTAADSVGPNHGVTHGSIAYGPGVVGQGFDLNGVSWVDVANPIAGGLQLPAAFTVAGWIRIDSYSGTSSIINLRTSANASGFTLENQFSTGGTLLFAVNNTGVAEGFATVSAPGWPTGTFFHVAATFDAATGTMAVYRDGVVVVSRSDLPHTNMATNPASLFQIGRNIVSASQWDGLIDELSVFNRALSASEITCMVQPGRIAEQPASVKVCPGGTTQLHVGVRGLAGQTFQWRKGTSILTGKTTDTLVISDADGDDQGSYDCIVTTTCGTVTTTPAQVQVCPVDLNCDGLIDFGDYLEFLNRYDAQDLSVDFNGDGLVDFSDYLEFLNRYDAGC